MFWIWLLSCSVRGYRFGASKAWTEGSDEEKALKRNKDSQWRYMDQTECFSGNEIYELKKIFCDAECVQDLGRNERCNGPWYCAKTEVCQKYYSPDEHKFNDPVARGCVVVRSCANHSQCFPSVQKAANEDNVLLVPELWETKKQVQDHGYTIDYAGFQMTTTCCSNRDTYKFDRDEPCNAASSSFRRPFSFLLLLFAGVYFLLSLIQH